MPRVVITGVGVISRDRAHTECLLAFARRRYLRHPRLSHLPISSSFASSTPPTLRALSRKITCSAKDISLMDRFAQFAVVAAKEAMAQSGLELTPAMREDGAVVTGSCIGGRSAEEIGYRELYIHNRNRVHPLTIPLA